MTDFETIREMLTRARIPFELLESDKPEEAEHIESAKEPSYTYRIPKETHATINVGECDGWGRRFGDEKESEPVEYVGYFGFYSTFYFDKDGALLNIGSWE